MFTGLVEALGTVCDLCDQAAARQVRIDEPTIAADSPVGSSVAVNGVCLTVIERSGSTMLFQVGPETLRCTNLGELTIGARVNLERALQVGGRLGGHLVQGHVDGLATMTQRCRIGDWEYVDFTCSPALTREMVRKGSIAVDGVSLTLVDVSPTGFRVALIPHTLAATTLGFKQPPATVNLETDCFAKMIVKYLDDLQLRAALPRLTMPEDSPRGEPTHAQ
ncbi:MAG: riboflavin synthase [Gemmataceae bacterium]|nr:riboflavin synthase [Gemmataceae bacterium]